jgi:HEPN domain-containing protein
MSDKKRAKERQWQEAARWLDRVDRDLAAIEVLIKADLADSAAMHCQQAVEKLAKAFIVAMEETPAKTHEIGELSDVVAIHDADLAARLRALSGLTRWYFSVRYPVGGDETGPTLVDVIEAHGQILQLRRRLEDFAPARRE